jgi:hypothetical protein
MSRPRSEANCGDISPADVYAIGPEAWVGSDDGQPLDERLCDE